VIEDNSHLTDFQSLRSILERGPAVIYHCKEYWDYGFGYVSPNVVELLGWSPSDFTDNPVFRQEIIHPDDLDQIKADVQASFGHERQTHEYRLRKKDGTYIWVMDDIRSLLREDGHLEGVVGYLTDITETKITERSLRESELRHRAIFETVLEGIISIDSKGIVQDMNKAAENIFGYDSKEVIGQNISMLMPDDYAHNHDGYLARYHETGERRVVGVGREVHGLRKNGDVFNMGLSVSELVLPEGKFFVGCIRDISSRINAEKALRTSQERLKTSQDFAKFGTWDWHVETDKIFWSEQVALLFGHKLHNFEMTYETYIEHIYPDDREKVKDAIRNCVTKGKNYDIQHRIVWPDGSLHWLHEQGDVIRNEDGRATRMLGILHDITETKLREKELEEARIIADNANKAKSEFLSRMSHELRTPLNAILGFAQLLGISRKHPLEERQQKQVAQIVDAGKHLLDLINEVLDLAKIEAGHLSLSIEGVNMEMVLEECISLTQPLADEKGISLVCDPAFNKILWVDRTRLKQVLLNLLSNAVKYNNEDGRVHLQVTQQDPKHIRFSIIDTGRGMTENQQSQLFKPFNRLGAEQGDIEGTGIGLTLTKQLVEAMDGVIGLESEAGKGTTFWVDLPLATDTNLTKVQNTKKIFTLKSPKTLLYVEDNQTNHNVMMNVIGLIGNLGFVSTKKAEDGLALIEKTCPDMIVLDINLSGIDGIELVRLLRQMPEVKNVPIYALSANVDKEIIKTALAAGFDDYLTKPLDVKDFTKKIMTHWTGDKE